MPEVQDRPISIRLSEMCWPVFRFVTFFVRQAKQGVTPDPMQVRYEAVNALRDAEDMAREDPVTERAWTDRVKAMMVYFIDYKMQNTDWPGSGSWMETALEISPDGLNESGTVGGERFFEQCDEVQKEYEQAERRDRRDRDELAGILNLYYTCIRLGFRGRYHDYPQELADYTRRLFSRLPAYGSTRGKEMFPEAYKSNQEIKVDYRLGMKLTVALVIFVATLGMALVGFRVAWASSVSEISKIAREWATGLPAPPEGGEEAVTGDAAGAK
ncbi:MAG: DotU family type IV/VI secretion system protein [Phycisphaerae bacterium]|jgi:type IV/VI secretion system ImpK/VasF family protein